MNEKEFYPPLNKPGQTCQDSNTLSDHPPPTVNYFQASSDENHQNYVPPSFSTFGPAIISKFSTDYQVDITTKLCELDTRLSKYNDFNSMTTFLFVWSLLILISNMYSMPGHQDDVQDHIQPTGYEWKGFPVLNLFANLFHVIGYFYGLRAYNKQSSQMMGHMQYILMVLSITNFLYFFIYIFYTYAGFLTFCVDMIYLVFNLLMYFQAQEMVKLYKEKEELQLRYRL